MLFISYILFYHIFSYTILYCHILYICVFTPTIELIFTTDSRGNLIMFVIPYIFILYFSYTIFSYDFHILYFHIICRIHFMSLTLYFLYLYTGCETSKNPDFLRKDKMVISVKIQNFSRSRMTKRTSPLESSREI